MAVVTISEAQAAARTHVDTLLAGVKACLTDSTNIAVLLFGTTAVASTDIRIGTMGAQPIFPSIWIDEVQTTITPFALGGGNVSDNEYQTRFRLEAFGQLLADEETLSRNTSKLADRIIAVLHANFDRQGDSLWRDLTVHERVMGFLGSNKHSVRGVRIEATVTYITP